MLKTLFLVLMTTALINNVVLSQFLGICHFSVYLKMLKQQAGMGRCCYICNYNSKCSNKSFIYFCYK